MASPNIISQEALNLLTDRVWDESPTLWTPREFLESYPTEIKTGESIFDVDIEHFCAAVIHPETGETITKYKVLANDQRNPELRETWRTAFGKEVGRLAQGDDKTGTKGKNCIFVMTHEEIKDMFARGKKPTYARIVVDFRPQKEDPNRVRITAGGNLIQYAGDLTTRTADLTVTKMIWNSVVSTPGAKYAAFDVGDFYLETPLEEYEYMKMPLALFPQWTRDQYDLDKHAYKGFVYWEVRKAIYGLPQAGALANKQLRKNLKPHGYYEVQHTPGLWKHKRRPIMFSLIVDDFGIKYVGKEHAMHLKTCLETHYTKVTADWKGTLYAGIDLEWNYEKRWVKARMKGYVKKLRQRFNHKTPTKPVHSPYKATPKVYGADAQNTITEDTSPKLKDKDVNIVQQVVGVCLYYGRAIDDTILPALSSIASEQTIATENTMKKIIHLMDYLATHPDAVIMFRASDMILNVHSDASYLSEKKAKSRMAGYFFLGSMPKKNKDIIINGSIHVLCGILRIVVCSAAEAELGALFLNMREAKILRLMLQEMGHQQPATPVHCDNSTAVAIANDTVKKQRSRSMEMRFFWVTGQVKRNIFNVLWHPGAENLADYFTKHFPAAHHIQVRPWYQHEENSTELLPRAAEPKALRGCVGTLDRGYTKSGPLPKLAPFRAPIAKLTRALAAHMVRITNVPYLGMEVGDRGT